MKIPITIREALQQAALYCSRVLLVVLGLANNEISWAQTWQSRSMDLGDTAQALRVDGSRNEIYVSVPNANRVFFIDADTLQIVQKVYVGFHPTGIDLGEDGNTLYAALNQAGAIAVYDLATDTGIQIDISITLGDSHTWDVLEAYPGVVFASANPCDAGFSYITRIDIAQQTSTRGAGNNIYRCAPIFARDPGQKKIYMASQDSFVVYALDATQLTAPVVTSSLSGINIETSVGVQTNPNGAELVFGNGNIVSTSTMGLVATVPPGPAIFSPDGKEIVVASGVSPITFSRYSTTTQVLIESVTSACTIDGFADNPTAIERLANGTGWAVLAGTALCTLRQIPDGIYLDGFGG